MTDHSKDFIKDLYEVLAKHNAIIVRSADGESIALFVYPQGSEGEVTLFKEEISSIDLKKRLGGC